MNAHILANELKNKGFKTRVINSSTIEVSLTARMLSVMEVEISLDEIFDFPACFVVYGNSINGSVIVTE